MSKSRAIVLPLPAELDIANADQVHADLVAVIDQGYATVVADLSGTSFCDCAGVAALLAAGNHAASGGAQLRIAVRAKPVLRVFELTGLPLALPVYPSSRAALHEPAAGTRPQRGNPAGGASPVAAASCLRQSGAGESAPQPHRRQCP